MASQKVILCDTNIIIELSKNNLQIIDELKAIGSGNIAVSTITAGELIFGALNKSELRKIIKGLKAIEVISINEEISSLMLDLIQQYSLSHRLSMPDAFIAATAIFYELPLYTLNLKDFKFIQDLQLHQELGQSK